MKKLITSFCFVLTLAGSALGQESTPPGLRYPLWDWRFVNVNDGPLPQIVGYWMKEDVFGIRIEDGASRGLTSDEIEIELTSQVELRKEISAWSSCSGSGLTISTEGPNRGPVTMRLNRANRPLGNSG